MKSITLNQEGWIVKGIAEIEYWGGGRGYVNMDTTFIPLGHLNKGTLLNCINDGQFGCQRIISAQVQVYESYGSTTVYRTMIEVDHPRHTKHFGKRGI